MLSQQLRFLQEFVVIQGLDPFPDIDMIDISLWNESGALIQWPEVQKDPRKIRGVWVKCGEGTLKRGEPGAYDYAIYERQMKGAESVGMVANAYWFWYYHLPWSIDPETGNWVYMVLDPTKQAEAFAASVGPFANLHPLIDIEDMYVGQFLVWSDTASANAAIAFARKVNANLKKFAYEVWRIMKKKPDIYTGAWWMKKVVNLLIDNGYWAEVEWMKEFGYYLADYNESDGLELFRGIDISNVLAWQYDLDGITPPIMGIPNGNKVDVARWMQSPAKFDAWAGLAAPVVVPTALPDVNVKQTERAKVLTIRPDQKWVGPISGLGIDAVILPMGGMAGTHLLEGHWLPYTEETFQGRAKLFIAADVPVIGSFALDPGALLKEQHDAGEIDGLDIRRNYILDKLISAWHDGPWTWDSVFAKQGKWLPISGLELEMVSTDGWKGAIIPNDWQGRVFRLIINHLKVLMGNRQIPVVPIDFYSGPWWLKYYNDPNSGIIFELSKHTDTLWMRMGEWVLGSTSTFDTLADIFAFRPDESFRFGKYQDDLNPDGTIKKMWTVPDKYKDRVTMHEYTGETQGCRQITDAKGNPTKVSLSLWKSTKKELLALLKPTVVPPTPSEVEELRALVAELTATVAGLEGVVDRLEMEATVYQGRLKQWSDWVLTAPGG